MTPTLNGRDVGDRHRYLARALPSWSSSMAGIKAHGGPWWCDACESPSLLSYRCSICGRDLCGDSGVHRGY